MSVPVNKETFDALLATFLDAANRKPGTFSLDRAHTISTQLKKLTSTDDEKSPEEKKSLRSELLAAVVRGHENGAYGITDSGLARELVQFVQSNGFDN